MKHRTAVIGVLASALIAAGIAFAQTTRPGATPLKTSDGITHIPVTITGGHEIDPRDHGRPVVLVAGGLGVTPEVFRKAFSGVTPAEGRGPTGDEARRNKAALMKVLAPYGITNDRLDEVSNQYRYRPGGSRLWTHTEAEITADVKNGKVTGFTITNSGAGYTMPPKIEVPGFGAVNVESKVIFATELERNGSISQVKLAGN